MRQIYIDGIREVGIGEGYPWPSSARLEAFGELVRYDRALAERLLQAKPGSCWVRVRHRAAEPIEAHGYRVELVLDDRWRAYAVVYDRIVACGWGASPAEAIQALAGELGIPMGWCGNGAGYPSP